MSNQGTQSSCYGIRQIGETGGTAGCTLRMHPFAVEEKGEIVVRYRGEGKRLNRLIEAREQAPGEGEGSVLIIEVVRDDEIETCHLGEQ